MRKFFIIAALVLAFGAKAGAEEYAWKAKWITKQQGQSETNTWLAYRKDVDIEKVPVSLIARIAVDSRYWLWINGQQVVFEGGLKRGPSIGDGYYDKVEIAPFLKKGQSVAQNFDRMFFQTGGELVQEFNVLYASLFKNPKRHIAIISALAKKKCG